MYRVSNIYDRVCIDIHDTRYTKLSCIVYRTLMYMQFIHEFIILKNYFKNYICIMFKSSVLYVVQCATRGKIYPINKHNGFRCNFQKKCFYKISYNLYSIIVIQLELHFQIRVQRGRLNFATINLINANFNSNSTSISVIPKRSKQLINKTLTLKKELKAND